MISFDNLVLKAFLQETENFFIGARIQKIQQPTRKDFILTLRNKGKTEKLYININPQLYHVCFLNKESEAKRHIEIPKQPPMFCMLLRKHLENAKISKIIQPKYERILELYVETYNELSEKIDLCLAIELMGKHSNVILYNYDTNIILGCAHNIGTEKSRTREMAGTLPYIYPPKQHKSDILSYFGEINYETLHNDFLGISKAFSTQCKGIGLAKIQEFMKLNVFSPVINKDYSEYCLFSELLSGCFQSSINTMIDNYFAFHQEKELLKTLKSNLLTLEQAKLKKIKASIEKMQKQLLKEKNADNYKLFGNLIMANLYNNNDFEPCIEVLNYETGKKLKIDLDSTKTLKDNANRYFKLYNKQKRSKEKVLILLEELKLNKIYQEQTIYSIGASITLEELFEIKNELLPNKNPKKELKSTITEEKVGNFTVLIGKNNKQNDFIISKLSKDEDLWFHTKDCAGSHVLLKTEKGSDVTDELILKCAELAKIYSDARNSSKVSVIYTKRKYLKKPPASNLGYVTYKNEKEILIN